MFVNQFCLDNNVFFEFYSSYFCVKNEKTKRPLLQGPSCNKLYPFFFFSHSTSSLWCTYLSPPMASSPWSSSPSRHPGSASIKQPSYHNKTIYSPVSCMLLFQKSSSPITTIFPSFHFALSINFL